MKNPFKWIARIVLRKELSASAARIAEQELIITRLRNTSDVREVGKLIRDVKSLQTALSETETRISGALAVHDNALRPNATVKRMARILRGEQR